MTQGLPAYYYKFIKLQLFVLLILPKLIFAEQNQLNLSENTKSFKKIDYNAARQNWSVSSSSKGFVYFANHQGLLEFDGTSWSLYKLPNETIIRAVKVKNDSVIYTSGYMEMGYWKPDEFGKLHYYSLTEKAKDKFTKNIEFWNIACSDSIVYFQSFNQILAFHSDSASVVLPYFISVMNKVNDKILVAVRNKGIYVIDGITAKPFITGDFFENKTVQFLIPFINNQILIGTASHGIFVWNGKTLETWNNQWTDYFIKNELNRGFFTKNRQVVLGTIIGGVVVFDETGNLISKINTQNGLPNNTILGIETDEWQNLWLALDDGIGFIPHNYKKGFSIEKINDVGAIYSMSVLKNIMYLGTNQGLFMKPINRDDGHFSLIPKTQGQVWDCQIIENQLWVGHNSGTFIVDGLNAKQISNQAGGFAIKPDPLNPDLLIQGTYNDLTVYEKAGDSYKLRNRINGFSDLVRYIEIDHLGNIWASHLHRGIYKITTDDNRENVKEVAYFGKEKFIKNIQVNVFKVENRIVFTTGDKIFTYDDLNDSIILHPTLNAKLGEYASSHRIIEAPSHHYWFTGKKNIGLFSILQDSVKLVKEFPVSLFKDPPLVDGFENIFPVTEDSAFLCLQNGIAKLDASETGADSSIVNFKPVLRQFELYSSNGKTVPLALSSNSFKIKNNFNNIVLRFSIPHFTDLPVLYQYKLEGLNAGWSEPSANPVLNFERLPAGEYMLSVKAVNPWKKESRLFTCAFKVMTPWYASTAVILIYILLFVLALLLFRRWGIRMTKRKVQHQHEEREKELIRLRNTKLLNEVEHKSKELASSTMSIIKKNEFLMQLKEIIEKQKAELGSRYPDKYFNHLNKKIDENISNQDDWQIFQNHFEQAHHQFFAKMKAAFPQLTPSDLRLCAYLRMNLSSKEIAPLLGISVRGVENHRYKLRKKMNVEHDKSLVNIINGA